MFLAADGLALLLLLDLQLIEDLVRPRVNFAPAHGECGIEVGHFHLAPGALVDPDDRVGSQLVPSRQGGPARLAAFLAQALATAATPPTCQNGAFGDG